MTHDPGHWAFAGTAVAVWLILVVAIVVSGLRSRRARTAAIRDDAKVMATGDGVLIAFASQTGLAEDLAQMTARAFADSGQTDAGQRTRVVSFADLDLAMLKAASKALFVVSTTGEGDAPDSAGRVVRRLMSTSPALPHLSYGLLALGDRSYRDFCGFGRAVDGWLRRAGALPLFDVVEVDDADPAAIRHWQHQLTALAGGTSGADWTPPAYDRWRLVQCRLINADSPGGEAFHLAFEPVDHLPVWVAGDIAEIGVPGGAAALTAREYSIASLPADQNSAPARLEILVRLMRHPDGTPGLGSGWLTGGLTPGQELDLRVRTNRAFHGPDASVPMILIGNGTGIAGLRAHLKARIGSGGETWLMFGERTAAHDAFYDDELQTLVASGDLTRLDRAFSRDPGDGRYVQALIAEQAAEVTAWVARGAVVYVCGSLQGMASGVHAALETVLGAEGLADLAETGRYRRDVY